MSQGPGREGSAEKDTARPKASGRERGRDPEAHRLENAGLDVPEGDRLDQEREWVDEGAEPAPRVQLEDSEADVLEQNRDAGLDDDEWKSEP